LWFSRGGALGFKAKAATVAVKYESIESKSLRILDITFLFRYLLIATPTPSNKKLAPLITLDAISQPV
jgi:hypothetical protein